MAIGISGPGSITDNLWDHPVIQNAGSIQLLKAGLCYPVQATLTVRALQCNPLINTWYVGNIPLSNY
jgi:hypothetical protein